MVGLVDSQIIIAVADSKEYIHQDIKSELYFLFKIYKMRV